MPPGGSRGKPGGPPPCLHHPLQIEVEVATEAVTGAAGPPTSEMTAHTAPDAARSQPDPPQSPDPPAPRAPSMQPSVVLQPADRQAAAIQTISDQLARMQQDAREFQAAAAREREADRQEMLRRTAAARPPAPGPSQGPPQPGPSHREQLQTSSRLPYPAVDFGMPARQLPPYPTQGYCTPVLTQAPRPPGLPAPPKAQSLQAFRDHGPATRRRGDVFGLLPTPVCSSYQLSQGRNSLDVPVWTPSCFNRWRIQLQPCEQTPTPPRRPISSSGEWV